MGNRQGIENSTQLEEDSGCRVVQNHLMLGSRSCFGEPHSLAYDGDAPELERAEEDRGTH